MDVGSFEVCQFVWWVEECFGGFFKVELWTDYFFGSLFNEVELVRDLRVGYVDFGVLLARVWVAVGVKALDALQVLFVFGDYDVVRVAFVGSAGQQFQMVFECVGVVPFGFVFVELRCVLLVYLLVIVDAFCGLVICMFVNVILEVIFWSFGVGAIQSIMGDDVLNWLCEGCFDGVEIVLVFVYDNDYMRYVWYITGFVLFDCVDIIVVLLAAWKWFLFV